MGDMGEVWDGYREALSAARLLRLPVRTAEILALRSKGYLVKELTPYQFRINLVLDVYPTHNRWHDLPLKKRGDCANLAAFIRKRLKPYYTVSPS